MKAEASRPPITQFEIDLANMIKRLIKKVNK